MSVQLVEHSVRQGGGIEDGMAAMDHMVVEGQDHESRIGDDPAEDAGVHRVKIAGPLVNGRAKTGDGFIRRQKGNLHARLHSRLLLISDQIAPPSLAD